MPRLWQLAGVAAMLGASAYGTLLLSKRTDGITTLWPCIGLFLGVLLRSPRRHWISYFAVFFAVDMCVNAAAGGPHLQQLLLAFCNMTEAWLAAAVLSWVLPRSPDLTRGDQLVKFLFFGAILVPAVTSVLACCVVTAFDTPDIFSKYASWFEADALGIATMTPLYLSISRRNPALRKAWWEGPALFFAIVLVTVFVFSQDKYPFLFVILPFLLLAGVRLGLAGASFGLIIVTVLGGYMTSLGHGPVTLVPHASTSQHVLVFQFFIAISMLMLYGAEVVARRNSSLQQAVAASEARFRLITESSRDIIILGDLEGRRQYVSPAAVEILGWKPEVMLAGTYRDIVHPDDLKLVARLLENCRDGVHAQPTYYRIRKSDGTYLWVETTLRLYHDPDSSQPTSVVSVMRDISGRKAAEEELQIAYKAAEALATVDGLTGLPNRRRFDEVMLQEWLRAAREQGCISLLMFDVDRFKTYNDLYGHVRGDDCLRQIAEIAQEVVRRPGDLIARFGGDEFVVVLPNTDAEGSREIAEDIRRSVDRCGLLHSGSAHGMVTISVGSATMMPHRGSESANLIEAADRALYHAKECGRNQIQIAGAEITGKDCQDQESDLAARNEPAASPSSPAPANAS